METLPDLTRFQICVTIRSSVFCKNLLHAMMDRPAAVVVERIPKVCIEPAEMLLALFEPKLAMHILVALLTTKTELWTWLQLSNPMSKNVSRSAKA